MSHPNKPKETPAPAANFIRNIIDADLAGGKFVPARIRTRFPPEPNGYLHFGHAKSILLNFGLARDYGGRCNLRFDDTNPTKEEQEYVDSIIEAVHWLECDWGEHQYFASDYFDRLYGFAEAFIQAGLAYVDSQDSETIRQMRGDFNIPGRDSPFRVRSTDENLNLFRRMKAGEFADGAHVLRLKIDMKSPNLNLRDPLIYRIRHATHHRTGDTWCIYPLYDFTHGISDALEGITHSICTLEFEDHRPLYDWINEQLAALGQLPEPLPHQYEFSRLNLTYTVLSKRKLIQLVEEKHVDGWDDPRMPTLVGARRRGYTPGGFRLLIERLGVSKSESWIGLSVFEDCMREDLNEHAERRIAVLDPLKLIIDNFPAGQAETMQAPNHPLHPELGKRDMPFTGELWIEREDFQEVAQKGFHRLSIGSMARLRYAYVVKCTACDKDEHGNIIAVHCEYLPETRSGTPGADSVKVKGNLHWVSAAHACAAEVRLFDRLFLAESPGSERDYIEDLNPDSRRIIEAQLEPALKEVQPEAHFQFERHGYFVADRNDSRPGCPVFNRTVTLRSAF